MPAKKKCKKEMATSEMKLTAPESIIVHGSSKKGGLTDELLTCGRCQNDNTMVEFPHVLAGTQMVVFRTGCYRCFIPFSKSWFMEFTWPGICSSCTSDPEFDANYEKTCRMEEGVLNTLLKGNYKVEEITDAGYTIRRNHMLVPESDFAEVVGQQKLNPRSADVAQECVPDASALGSTGVIQKQWAMRTWRWTRFIPCTCARPKRWFNRRTF